MEKKSSHPPIGIDLGTTFSAVAYLDDQGRPETIRNAEGDLTTPSAVFFDRKTPIVGIEAVEAGMDEPERLAMFAKRDIGEVAYEKQIRGQSLPPEVVQACLLRKLKADAELKLGPIQKVVITVPAFFNERFGTAWQPSTKAGFRSLVVGRRAVPQAVDERGGSNRAESNHQGKVQQPVFRRSRHVSGFHCHESHRDCL